jgi:hypothetical protein
MEASWSHLVIGVVFKSEIGSSLTRLNGLVHCLSFD